MLNITIQLQAENLQEALVALSSDAAEALMQTAAGPQPDATAPIIPISTAVPQSPVSTTASETPMAAEAATEPTLPVVTAPPVAVPPTTDEPIPTLQVVRAALADLRKTKSTNAARDILTAHGVDALSALPEADYAAVLREAQEAAQ